MRVYNPNYNPPPRMWYRVGMITNAAGVEINPVSINFDYQSAPNDGDHLYTFLYAAGGETILTLGRSRNANSGIFDMYIDSIIDSAGYDMYNAGTLNDTLVIALANALNHGYHTIEFRVNGKNGASAGYIISTYGMRVR